MGSGLLSVVSWSKTGSSATSLSPSSSSGASAGARGADDGDCTGDVVKGGITKHAIMAQVNEHEGGTTKKGSRLAMRPVERLLSQRGIH